MPSIAKDILAVLIALAIYDMFLKKMLAPKTV